MQTISVTAHSRKMTFSDMILRDSGTDREDLANAMSDGSVIIIIIIIIIVIIIIIIVIIIIIIITVIY